MKRSIAGLALGILLQPWMAFATSSPSTHTFTLDNGLKVIVHENHRAAVVHSQLWYKVGTSYEGPGQSGLSHALEHMVFNGSSKLCPAESDTILQGLGATQNAATSYDATYFYQSLPPQYLGVAFEIMADQMSTAHLSLATWVGELEIIKNERSEKIDATAEKTIRDFEALNLICIEKLASFKSHMEIEMYANRSKKIDMKQTQKVHEQYSNPYVNGAVGNAFDLKK